MTRISKKSCMAQSAVWMVFVASFVLLSLQSVHAADQQPPARNAPSGSRVAAPPPAPPDTAPVLRADQIWQLEREKARKEGAPAPKAGAQSPDSATTSSKRAQAPTRKDTGLKITRIPEAKSGRSIEAQADQVLVRFKQRVSKTEASQALSRHKTAAIGRKTTALEKIAYRRVQVPSGVPTAAFLTELSKDPAIERAEANVILRSNAEKPADPSFGPQWGLEAIRAKQAWKITEGDPSIIVAVVDSGIALEHPSLVKNLVPGYNFIMDNTEAQDDFGHGTQVAGIVAAQHNEALGTAGVAPRSRMMPLKVLDANGEGTAADVAEAIIYAADHGARVITLALGTYAESGALQAAVEYAAARNCLIIAAGGNNGTDEPAYPAAYPATLAVAAVDQFRKPCFFSNRAPYIDIAAPGKDILTTAIDGSYQEFTGTSAAAAHMAGLAALLLAKNPALDNNSFQAIVRASASDLDVLGWDAQTGFGLADCAAALNQTATSPVDVGIVDIMVLPQRPRPGQSASIIFTLRNHATQPVQSATLVLSRDGHAVTATDVPPLAPKQTREVAVPWVALAADVETTAGLVAKIEPLPDETATSDNTRPVEIPVTDTEYHDLAVVSMRAVGAMGILVGSGVEFVIEVEIANKGNVTVQDGSVSIFLGKQTEIGRMRVALAPGEKRTLSFPWQMPVQERQTKISPVYLIKATITCEGESPELQGNNIKYLKIVHRANDDMIRVSHSNGGTHQWIAYEGYLYFTALIEDSNLGTYTNYMNYTGNSYANLLEGAWAEDESGRSPGATIPATPYLDHFVQGHENIRTGITVAGLAVGQSALNRAEYFQSNKISILWDTDKPQSVYWLGHITHLVTDMAVPAHVNGDWHLPGDSDGYETHMAEYENFSLFDHQDIPDYSTRVPTVFADPYSIFYCTVNYTDDYDSDDVDGDSTYYNPPDYSNQDHRPSEVTGGPWGIIWSDEIDIIADDLMPYAIARCADLYRTFYHINDQSAPSVSMTYPTSEDPNNPTIRNSLSAFNLMATASDPESGILKKGFQFRWSYLDGSNWSSWYTVSPSPTVNSVSFTPTQGETWYAFYVVGENGGGWRNSSAVKYLRVIVPDTTPPSPDPMTWSTTPYPTGETSIKMYATTASDASGVEYYFDCTTSGGHDSGWQDSRIYEDTGLSPGTWYTYRVKARDKSSNYNETAYSSSESAKTSGGGALPPPTGVDASSGMYAFMIRIVWDSVAGASSYEIWRAHQSSNSSDASLIAETDARVWDDYEISSGDNYYYWVKAKNPTATSGLSNYDIGYSCGGSQIQVFSPSAGETYSWGDSVAIIWWHGANPDGSNPVPHIRIDLLQDETVVIVIEASLATNPKTNYYAWTVPRDIPTGIYSIHLESTTDPSLRCSSGAFQILDDRPNKPTNPNPSNGVTGQSVNTDVSWSNGGGATSYIVYFGTDETSVLNATLSSPECKGEQPETSYDPGTLAYSTPYYWRIDAKNSAGTTTGGVWSFTTEAAEKPAVTYLAINNGAASTANRTVTLNNTCTGAPTQYMASESSVFSGASWQTYSTAPSFTLSSGNVTKTVYFKVKNGAGESSAVSDTIVLAQGTFSIVMWGFNSSVPTPNTGFVAVAAGAQRLGLKSDGSIVAWGANSSVPTPNTGFVAVAAGAASHSLGLKSDGSIVAWGSNSNGECDVPTPNTGFVALAAAYRHSLGLKSDGSIVGWGYNGNGECRVPAPNTGFVAIAAGYWHSLGLKSDGSIVAWGYDGNGECRVPTPNTGFVAVAAGDSHSLGLKADGSIVAWGWNYYGQCNVPTPNTGFVAVTAGEWHSLGLKADGSIIAWGFNSSGQCNVPTPNTGFVALAAASSYSLGLREDTAPVVTYFAINNGASSTTNRTVTLNNSCMGAPTQYMASESSVFSGASWQTYSTAPSFTLSSGNGTKTVYFKLKNAAGESSAVSDTIVLSEPVLPVVTYFAINNGASSTSSRNVTLNNSCTGSPTQYMASESPVFSGASWQTYSTAPSFTLSSGNGTKTVYFKVKNGAGESSAVSDTIVLSEPVLPVVTYFAINNGASSTASRTVTPNNTCTGSPTQYMASESSVFSGASWQTYSTAPSFTLSSGNGTKTVYFKVKNGAGESSAVSDTIVLSEPVLPVVTYFAINNGASSTASRTVTLNNSCTGSPTQYMASESSVFSGASWQTYSTAPSFTLSSGNGTKRVYFKVKNGAGESAAASDTITLNESTPPIKAKNPNPPNGAVDQPTKKQLSWENGGGATSYEVYFDGLFKGVQTETSYNPGTLAYGSGHTWKIDAKNSAGPTTGDPWSFTVAISRIREFIVLFYNGALGRDPEPGAVDAWEHGYYDYALTFNIDVRFIGREMGRLFFLSQEYNARNPDDPNKPDNRGIFITDCYRAFLGRDPNQWELSGWVNGVWTRGEAMTIFAESGEFANRMDLISTQRGDPVRNFVTRMYIGILDRLVDSGGLAYWADVMAGASNKRDAARYMAQELFKSKEYTDKNATTEKKVVALYRAFMGRFPGTGEIAYWVGELDSGNQTFDQVLDAFVNSEEFTAILTKYFGPQGSSADVMSPAKARSWEVYE